MQSGIVELDDSYAGRSAYALPALLAQLGALPTPTHLLVCAGRATVAVQNALRATPTGPLRITFLPTLTQVDFDHLLWACDLNCVRGEDSVVRALWAGRPLVWQIYPQDDAAHILILDAFLEMLDASPSLPAFHHAWNVAQSPASSPALPAIDLAGWSLTVLQARARLLQMDDLTTQILQFALKKQ